MTFALVSHMREQLANLVIARAEKRKRDEAEKARRAQEVLNFIIYAADLCSNAIPQEEDAKTKGTPVTRESFMAWKTKFDQEMISKKAQEEDEKLKSMSGKDREEWKKMMVRITGALKSKTSLAITDRQYKS